METQIPNKLETASVKVMRSHDYCHFEVCLTISNPTGMSAVDELRKEAARLADKAVEQYKVAKINAESIEGDAYKLACLRNEVERLLTIPEGERTPEQKAKIKSIEDRAHRRRPRYDYEDQWQEPKYPEDDNDSIF